MSQRRSMGPVDCVRIIREAVATDKINAAQVAEESLEAVEASPLPFLQVYTKAARAQAFATDAAREAGAWLGPLAGVPIALKDLLDVAGQVTTAGSPNSFQCQAPANSDAAAVERLRAAGALLVGKTHLSELAYTGLGHNPHYDTPLSPFGRGRVPGGSSSGSAVAVAEGAVAAAIGTDTGGSIRIPAAWCGVVGFKPSPGVVPAQGCLPLAAESMDSIGPIASSVHDCALVFRVMAGTFHPSVPLKIPPLSSLRFVVPEQHWGGALDEAVHKGFNAALSALEAAGARFDSVRLPSLKDFCAVPPLVLGAEAAASNADILADPARLSYLDKVVRMRLEAGQKVTATEYLRGQAQRRALLVEMDRLTAWYDALLLPTVPIVPPRLSDLLRDEAHMDWAAAESCRFTRLVNVLGRCAVSLPCHVEVGEGEELLPVGISVVGESGGDERCLSVAAAVEGVLHAARLGLHPCSRGLKTLADKLTSNPDGVEEHIESAATAAEARFGSATIARRSPALSQGAVAGRFNLKARL